MTLASDTISVRRLRAAIARAAVVALLPAALLRAAPALALVAAGPAALAQEEKGQDLADQPSYEISPQQLDRWTFGSMTRSDVSSRAEAEVGAQIDALGRQVGLSLAQRRKLDLAARGDLHRFFEEVDAVHRTLPPRRLTRIEVMDLSNQCAAAGQRLGAGLHGPGSLFAKTVRTTLDPDQKATIENAEKTLAETQHTERIQRVVTTIQACAELDDAQREKIETLLRKKTVPPVPGGSASGWHVRFLKSLLDIPDADWKPIFKDDQWEGVRNLLDAYREAMQIAERIEKQNLGELRVGPER